MSGFTELVGISGALAEFSKKWCDDEDDVKGASAEAPVTEPASFGADSVRPPVLPAAALQPSASAEPVAFQRGSLPAAARLFPAQAAAAAAAAAVAAGQLGRRRVVPILQQATKRSSRPTMRAAGGCLVPPLLLLLALALAEGDGRAGKEGENPGNFMEDEQWLSSIAQYSGQIKHWNRFRDVSLPRQPPPPDT
uniref:Uncharacterized protein n=1 Tax=Sphaerodactylus townsendi TaxID=933632 RepID=A0ACB8F8A5_9SAUR